MLASNIVLPCYGDSTRVVYGGQSMCGFDKQSYDVCAFSNIVNRVYFECCQMDAFLSQWQRRLPTALPAVLLCSGLRLWHEIFVYVLHTLQLSSNVTKLVLGFVSQVQAGNALFPVLLWDHVLATPFAAWEGIKLTANKSFKSELLPCKGFNS